MVEVFRLVRPVVHWLSPETAHQAGICALRYGLLGRAAFIHHPMLTTQAFGLSFRNPLGLAAGFDKNAVAVDALLAQGFGFVEAGTVTPRAQSGNPKPRIFRLSHDEAVINRLGFNNNGLDEYLRNFARHKKDAGIAGANIGKNKDSTDAVQDYITGLKAVFPLADYITVNISSPNTKGLRDLQQRDALGELLGELLKIRNVCAGQYGKTVPLLLKVAPDLAKAEIDDVVSVIAQHPIDGLIVSNTTVSRPESLCSAHKQEQGGLSGRPLFALSTQVLRAFYERTEGKIPLVGVGGIASAEDAYTKIRAGAALVQLYSALVYQGFGLVERICNGLPELLQRDGFSHISEAIGADVKK
ncbi:MAG: quinone-dependent dihydroorotate dehydrogenase [Alphaproteobacteria bacterium]